jgi:hypothetical protein
VLWWGRCNTGCSGGLGWHVPCLAAGRSAGVGERQAGNLVTLGAAVLGVEMLGGTAMMGTAGLAML